MVIWKNHLNTDAIREIRSTITRYLSILVLAALAVAFLSGLRTTAPDMQYTADNYYDRTHLMDGYVLSTLGLTDGDLAALAGSPGIEAVEGCRDVDAVAIDRIVSVRSMPEQLNLLELKQGRLPQSADECVTENLLLVELGLQVGDKLELILEEDSAGDLERHAYTIVGSVNSPLYVGLDRGSSSLGSGSVDAFVYVPGENFTFEHYTCAYFTGDGLAALDTYGDEYEDRVDALVDSLDPLAEERAQLRYDELIGRPRLSWTTPGGSLRKPRRTRTKSWPTPGRSFRTDGRSWTTAGRTTATERTPSPGRPPTPRKSWTTPWPTCARGRPTWPTASRSMRTVWRSTRTAGRNIGTAGRTTWTAWRNTRRAFKNMRTAWPNTSAASWPTKAA